jgi:O-antigen/teichoic acid export membrane protein
MGSIRCMTGLLVGAIVALIAIVKLTVVLLAALLGSTVVAALLAYLKREQWTKPAYRWARDTSGRWSATPWTPADKGTS